ncbi:MAG: molybdenum cofactor biosynthesis protein MoaE [Pseudomonadota bacterium]|nr:molybdenum cofactor biosynthesis protein MoaE [Pseudomonadota bacterium]
MVAVDARLAEQAFRPEEELAAFLAGLTEEGGVVSFVGIARPRSTGGQPVERLFLDHHPRLTQRSLEEIGGDALRRFDATAVRVVHRCGEVLPGEPIVFAAAAATHRRAAFEAADYLMDRLKTDAVFWKREEGVDGSAWIEPTEADRRDRARWSNLCPE